LKPFMQVCLFCQTKRIHALVAAKNIWLVFRLQYSTERE